MRWMWIDAVTQYEPDQRLVAVKNVSLAEEHLHDHFPATETHPALPLMPNSLIIEGMAQTAGLLVGSVNPMGSIPKTSRPCALRAKKARESPILNPVY